MHWMPPAAAAALSLSAEPVCSAPCHLRTPGCQISRKLDKILFLSSRLPAPLPAILLSTWILVNPPRSRPWFTWSVSTEYFACCCFFQCFPEENINWNSQEIWSFTNSTIFCDSHKWKYFSSYTRETGLKSDKKSWSVQSVCHDTKTLLTF